MNGEDKKTVNEILVLYRRMSEWSEEDYDSFERLTFDAVSRALENNLPSDVRRKLNKLYLPYACATFEEYVSFREEMAAEEKSGFSNKELSDKEDGSIFSCEL